MSDIEQAIVVANEHSSNAARMRRQIDKLDIPVTLIMTELDGRRTSDALLSAAREGHVIFAAGGDGTTNLIGNTLLSEEGQERGLHRLPFVSLRGGNANDIATMLNGRKTAAQILRLGTEMHLHPLEMRAREPHGDRIGIALGYFSVGATAAASQRLEEVKSTANRFTRAIGFQLGREAIASWLAVGDSKAFKLQHDGEEAQTITDYLILRGNRIAKLGRPHADLREPLFEAITSETDGETIGRTRAISDMLKMQQGRLYGSIHNSVDFTVTSATGEPVPIQYDGETDTLVSGSHIHVGISTVPYRTISTTL